MDKPWSLLEQQDAQVYSLIEAELKRQRDGIELIASENFASQAVVACGGNVFTNKYAEGRPGKRYYGGCEVVDELEDLAIERAKKLFGCKFANVQPHSGAQANTAVFLALAEPGSAILGMDLSHGGHLSHGSPVNFSGIAYQPHAYGLDLETERLDYDQVEDMARKVRPKILIAGASAYPRQIDFARFRAIADEVGAILLVDMAHIAGLVATGKHPSPFPHAHVVTTTTHKTLRGPRGGLILWNDEELTARLNKGVFPGTQGGPLEHIIAAKAVCFQEALKPEFADYQKQVVSNAQALGSELVERGLRLVSGGTENHLLLVDLSESERVSGKDLEIALGEVAITVNKNTVPREKRSPFVTSGIRIGTPAVTSRGMGSKEMRQIGSWIGQVFSALDQEKALDKQALLAEVQACARSFPMYSSWA